MAIVGELNVKLGVDDSGFNKGVDQAESKSRSVGKSIAGTFGKAGVAIGKAFVAGTLIVGTAIVGFSAKAISVASDLEEVQNVVDTTFGESAKQIEKFADTAGTQFGLSELAAKQFASGIGAVLTPSGLGEDAIADMSENLTGLSGDMASFFNVASEESFAALRAGILGETEPLKKFGIVMSVANLDAFALAQGLDKTTGEMTQAELATLRYNFILDATSKVQGDFEKTSESLANQQRIAALNTENLAKVFGEQLLPIAGKALGGINDLITGLTPEFEGLAEGLGGLLAGQEGAGEQFKENAIAIVTAIADAFGEILPRIIEIASSILPVVVEAIVAGIPILIDLIVSILPLVVEAIAQLIPMVIGAIIEALPGLIEVVAGIIPGLLETLLNLIPLLIEAGIQIILILADTISTMLPTLIPTIVSVIVQIVQILLDNLPLIIDAALQIIIALAMGIIAALPVLLEGVPEIIGSLVKAILGLEPQLRDAGMQLIMGLWEGIKSIDLAKLFSGLGDSVVSAFKDAFGIDSPSTLIQDEISEDVALGLIPRPNIMKKVTQGLDNFVGTMVNGLSVPQMAGVGVGGGDINIIVEGIHLANGSPEEAARAGQIVGENIAVELSRARGNQ